jgi:hypothetical protein
MRALHDLPPVLTRAWVRLYTKGMPPELRNLRCAEVDADLWEHQHEAQGRGVSRGTIAVEIIARTALGIRDDLGWRRDTMRARRNPAIETRRTTMAISTSQLRWMGLCAALPLFMWVSSGVAAISVSGDVVINTEGTFERIVWAISSVLWFLGALGFYLQERQRVGKVGSTGLIFLLADFTCSLIATPVLLIFGESNIVGGIFAILAWPLLIPIGLLLIGLGVRIPNRGVMLAVTLVLAARMLPHWAGLANPDVFPWTSILFTKYAGFVTQLLWAVCLAIIGYAMWSGSRTSSAQATIS